MTMKREHSLFMKLVAQLACFMLVVLYLPLPAGTAWAESQGPTSVRSVLSVPTVQQSYQGEPISIKLVNVSLVDFFRTISELSGLNILIDPDVRGTITINVDQVPWDQLFDWVLKSHNLDRTVQGNLVRISTKETLRKEKASVEALKKAEFLASDTRTETFHLNYAVSGDMQKTLTDQLSARGQINVDERTNTLIVTDIDSSVKKVAGLVKELDVPERQVNIEARIVEATTNFARDLGTKLGLDIGKLTDRAQGSINVNAPAEGPVGTGGLKLGKLLDTFRLDSMISAAEDKGQARILSKPRVSAQNNAEAVITQGSKIPIPVQQNFTTTVRYETAALQLTVVPQITEQKTVMLNIKVENNVPDFSTTVLGIPTILTSESQTLVLVPDGGTTVIGGIYTQSDRKQDNKVPGLGDIPLVGHLFKRSRVARDTREILFFITAKIRNS